MENKSIGTEEFNTALAEVTMSKVIGWIHGYNGNNQFLSSCKISMTRNRPLLNHQLSVLKKCYAYFSINEIPAKPNEEEVKIINGDIAKLLTR